MTDLDMAEEFVEKTGVDALAVSIGTAHGLYSSNRRLISSCLKELLRRLVFR